MKQERKEMDKQNKNKGSTKKYKTIKWVLKQQIEKVTKTLWTWQKGNNEQFTCIYKNYNDDLPIYTPTQLLKEIQDANTN
jgi:AAA15 family ATPase/GTPase